MLGRSLPLSGPQSPHVGGVGDRLGGFSRPGYSEGAEPWKERNGPEVMWGGVETQRGGTQRGESGE